MSICSRRMSRVVPATSVTMADLEAVDQQPALARLFLQHGERSGTVVDSGQQYVVIQEVDLFLGEVDCGFDVQAQPDQFFGERVDGVAEATGHRAKRGPRRLRRAAPDQVGDGLGLHQVQLAVQEGALRELARLGEPCAEIDDGFDEHRYEHRAAVALQLQNGFAGE